MGPSTGYAVQKEWSRKLRHDGVATCYKNGANSTGRRQKAETNSCAAYCSNHNGTTQYQAGGKKQKPETRLVCRPPTKQRRSKPMIGTFEQNTNTTMGIAVRINNMTR